MNKWIIKSVKYILNTKRIKIKEVELENSENSIKYEIIEREPSIAILAINNEENIILVRQYRVPVGCDTIDIPGGGINSGEEEIEAAKRELEEETGYVANNITPLITYFPDSGRTEGKKTVFLARDLVKTKQKLDFNENIEIIEMKLNELIKHIKSNSIKENTLLIAIGAYLIKENA